MPFYEFECNGCGHRFELMRRVSEIGRSADCPNCGKAAKKVFSPIGIVFKGSGFYCTDSKKSGACSTDGPAAACGGEKAACAAC